MGVFENQRLRFDRSASYTRCVAGQAACVTTRFVPSEQPVWRERRLAAGAFGRIFGKSMTRCEAPMKWAIVLLCTILGALGAYRPSGRKSDFKRTKES